MTTTRTKPSTYTSGWCAAGDHDRCNRAYEPHYPGKCQCAHHAINRATTKETP